MMMLEAILPLETIMGNQLAVVFKTFGNCQ
jgi:hypothetical protein